MTTFKIEYDNIIMTTFKIEYDNIIKNKDELLNQLESLKEEAIYMLRDPLHYEVFVKDLHALRIVINMIKEGF